MNVRLACLEVWTPAVVRRRMLDELATRVAGAFDSPPPRWSSRRYRDRLADFARFTETQARRVLNGAAAASVVGATKDGVCLATGLATASDPVAAESVAAEPVAQALRTAAAEMGADLRRRLAVRTPAQGVRVLRLLYRHIGIELDVRPGGRVHVRRCLFAGYYSAPVCALMSSVDDGIAAGLVGGGLGFTERLTEGAAECRGTLLVGG